MSDLAAEMHRLLDHFESWARDHSAEATAETWAIIHCSRETLRAAESPSAVYDNPDEEVQARRAIEQGLSPAEPQGCQTPGACSCGGGSDADVRIVETTSLCTVCGDATGLTCSDCRIDFQTTIYVCHKPECRDEHDLKCLSATRAGSDAVAKSDNERASDMLMSCADFFAATLAKADDRAWTALMTYRPDDTVAKAVEVEKTINSLRRALQLTTPTIKFELKIREAWNLLCRFAHYDWLDEPTELRRALDLFVEEARELTLQPGRDPTYDARFRTTSPSPPFDEAIERAAFEQHYALEEQSGAARPWPLCKNRAWSAWLASAQRWRA